MRTDFFSSENKRLRKELKEVRHELKLSKSREHIALHDSEVAFSRTSGLAEMVVAHNEMPALERRVKQADCKFNKADKEREVAQAKARDLKGTVQHLQFALKSREHTIRDISGRLSAAIRHAERTSES